MEDTLYNVTSINNELDIDTRLETELETGLETGLKEVEKNCMICLETIILESIDSNDLNDSKNYIHLDCNCSNNIYHLKCLQQWYNLDNRKNNKCLNCNKIFTVLDNNVNPENNYSPRQRNIIIIRIFQNIRVDPNLLYTKIAYLILFNSLMSLGTIVTIGINDNSTSIKKFITFLLVISLLYNILYTHKSITVLFDVSKLNRFINGNGTDDVQHNTNINMYTNMHNFDYSKINDYDRLFNSNIIGYILVCVIIMIMISLIRDVKLILIYSFSFTISCLFVIIMFYVIKLCHVHNYRIITT